MKAVFRHYPHNAENVIIMIIIRIYPGKDRYRTGSHQTETVYSGILFKKTKRREKKVTVRKTRTEKINFMNGTFQVA